MPTPPPRPARRAPDAVERLYVYWLVSTALLVLVLVTGAVVVRGLLQKQALDVQMLSDRVDALQQTTENLLLSSRPPAKRKTTQGSADGTRAPGGDRQPARPAPAKDATEPKSGADGRPPRDEQPALAEKDVRTQLDQIVTNTPVTPADVRDREAGGKLVEAALGQLTRARWSADTWSRLAVLARLLERDANAEAFAGRATGEAGALTSYATVSARSLLGRGRSREALALMLHLAEQRAEGGAARVLLAATYLATDNPALADETLEHLPPLDALPLYDTLVLARALLSLEHWERLDTVLAAIKDVPEGLSAEHSFLQAISLARSGRTVEALAILEYLAAHLPAREPGAAAPRAWWLPTPSRHELALWRGVTLMRAGQTEAARQALRETTELEPGRAAAHYYLGLLEARAGNNERAKLHFQNATARAAQLAPAWEALALLEIDGDELDAAVEYLNRAIQINARRASAHFLMAIAHAKRSQREPAAAALRLAFRRDERYLAEARQTEVLTRLFAPEEMDELSRGAGD